MISEKQLKEQLSEKELRIYELELEVKDLKSEVSDLYNTKDKLELANRNARVLEEENIELHNLVKGKAVSDHQFEAAKILQENEELRVALQEKEQLIRNANEKAKNEVIGKEKLLKEVASEKEKAVLEANRMSKELENVRHQCLQIQKVLDEERETAKQEREIWKQEKELFSQKAMDGTDVKKFNTSRQEVRGKSNNNTVQTASLHKEEVEFLENKIKEIQNKYWAREKEWIQQEGILKERINQLSAVGGGRSERNVIRDLQGQIDVLQAEINSLRSLSSKRQQSFSPFNDDNESIISFDANVVRGPNILQGKLSQEYELLLKENDDLRLRLERSESSNATLRTKLDEKDLALKELEYTLTVNNAEKTNGAKETLPEGGKTSPKEAAKQIKALKNKVAELTSLNEQQKTLGQVRQKEYQRKIDSLLAENVTNSGASGNLLGQDSVARLLKDKRDCVEDVMRLLEAAWQGEEEARDLLRRAQFQIAQLSESNALKDEEIRNLKKAVESMEDRLRDMFGENEKLRKELEDKEGVLDDLENNLRDLKNALNDLERENERLRDDKRKGEREMEDLRNLVDDLERLNEANNKYREGDIDAAKLLQDLRNENNRLRQQLASSPQRWSSPKRPSESQVSDRRRSAVPEGAHLSVTVVELSDVLRNGVPITEPGYVIIKLKSIKEKYKTTVRELSSVIRFDETFVFYLAQPDQDIITLHVFYKPKSGSKEYHIGDACFSMATLHRGVARQRIAPVAQHPGTKDARRSAQVEVNLQTDDFGKMSVPSQAEIQNERRRFNDLVAKSESSAPEILHAVDVYMAKDELL